MLKLSQTLGITLRHFYTQKQEMTSLILHGVCVWVLSHVWPFVTPWTVATSLLCPWDFPGKNTGVGCHFLLQGLLPSQGSNPRVLCLLHCRQILYHWAIPSALVSFANGPCSLNWASYFQSNVFTSSCSSISTHPSLKDYRGHFFNLTWI